jgi:CRISPR-associated protein Csd1
MGATNLLADAEIGLEANERRLVLPPRHESGHAGGPRGLLAANWGYAREKIQLAVVIGSRGQLVAVENLQTCFTRRSQRLMTVPQIDVPFRSVPLNFLWGKTGPALGIRRRRGPSASFRLEPLAFESFKAVHQAALAGVEDIGVEAFLRFLEAWSPEQFQEAPEFMDKLDATLVFRFQYDDVFLHDRNAARMAWRRVLEQSTPMRIPA